MGLNARPEHHPVALVIYAVSTLTLLGAAGISPILPILMEGLHLTEPEAGLVMTMYTLPVIVVVPIVGWLADRVGRRPPLIAGLFTFGLAGALIFFVTDFRTLLALRLVQGIGYSGVSPLTITLLGDLFDDDAEAGAQGLRVVSVNLGGFVFPIVTGALAGIAWNVPFLLFLLAIPAGFLVLYRFPAVATASEKQHRHGRGHVGAVLRTVKRPLIAGTLALGFVRFFMSYGVYTFLPLLITARDIGVGHVGIVIGSIGGVKVLVATQSRRSFNLGPPAITMASALLAGAVLITTFVSATTLPLFLVLASVYGISEGVIAPLQKTVLTQNAARTVRASVVSVNAILKNAGKTAAPVIVGTFIGKQGLADGFLYMGIGGAVVCGIILVAFVYSIGKR